VAPNGAKYSIVSDYLGTPTEMYTEAGVLAWKAQLDLYGVPSVEVGTRADCPWRWPGQYEDEETGLYYNRFRYYDTGRGGYLSQDPIGLRGGLVPYGYVEDPLAQTDVFGLSSAGMSPQINAADLIDKTPDEIRQFADKIGLVPFGSSVGRKWKDPITGKQRLRLDDGHIDTITGLPYDDVNAAVPHVHGYGPDGITKIRNPNVAAFNNPEEGNPHFPCRKS
jgi:RHS repeat-associated protein